MMNQMTCFKNALAAQERWSESDFSYKQQQLAKFETMLAKESQQNANVVAFHLLWAANLLEKPQQLHGATGEINEFYTTSRGVVVLICGHFDPQDLQAATNAFAMLTCALIAGNSLVVCSDNIEFNQLIEQTMLSANMPQNLIQVVTYDSYAWMLENKISLVSYIGHSQIEHEINLQLANQEGAIIGLISKTDLNATHLINDPHLVLRFVNERTRTINITAVGGNATLLELSSSCE